MNWWWLAAWLSGQVYGAWLWPAVMCRALKLMRHHVGHYAAWRDEMRPFAPLALVLGAYCQWRGVGSFDASDGVLFGVFLAAWLWLRNDKDDDDRWKRRRKKLAGKVAEVGGRLQVVPAGAES